ncbi:MAG: hypothetical protein N3F03_06595 [Ignavibacteria bacterium]|nr:hypothetical protein [Ignavibacteria bacterium]
MKKFLINDLTKEIMKTTNDVQHLINYEIQKSDFIDFFYFELTKRNNFVEREIPIL